MHDLTAKVKTSIDRLKAFEPPDGYFVAFSGGKDSQCVYHLCEMAGVKYDAHYNVTSVDPPELVRFIAEEYPDVRREIPHDKAGNPVTMWSLIPKKLTPPTRLIRYCCSAMKELNGDGRVTVTGVRWAESPGRRNNQGLVTMPAKSRKLNRMMEAEGANWHFAKAGGIVLNDDNDISRRMVEQCYRTHKTLVNPIIDWSDEDVWQFLRKIRKVKTCSLYDEGFGRLGCIGCPLASKDHREREFVRWPKYQELYMHAFGRMLAERERLGRQQEPTKWHNAQEVFDWWMERGILPGQIRMDELMMEGNR